jgi:hypothetical protein
MMKIYILFLLIVVVFVAACSPAISTYNKAAAVDKQLDQEQEEEEFILCKIPSFLRVLVFVAVTLGVFGSILTWRVPYIGMPITAVLAYGDYLLFACTFI